MRNVSLEKLYNHPIVQKYVRRSGMAHAIAVAEKAFEIAVQNKVDPDLAAKAGFLHDIGHYTWYRSNGEWDYQEYKQNDIHAIKGAARAHKLLVRCGEDLQNAKEIALAILLHTDSYLPDGQLKLSPLQYVVAKADQADELPGGKHHYRKIDGGTALARIQTLDQRINHYKLSNQIEKTVS
ncbi:HD domain-containing protein [Caldibacillus lycopersici]|uniref:HD domain-containing protein n=1 Tax=Perspicuibacillus lycopersici TaxID=1325689 RepID=A0AAE3IWZ7_9BACI|nr:HD domain-containing protein [Perspicuibacillus lycopersici]MCU9614929.1 HD domain-containing protein [Perspicuibacillus lycopersici]